MEPDPTPDNSLWLSDDRLLAIIEIAKGREWGDECAHDAIRDCVAEIVSLRQHVVIATGAFQALARSLDAVVYAANKAGDTRTVALIDAILKHEGLLDIDEHLLDESALSIPDTKTTKRIQHQGRVTKAVSG